MKFKPITKIGAFALAACLAFSPLTVLAAEDDKIEITLTDVTQTDTTTLSGEAKIKVSVSGAKGNATIAQTSFILGGDLKYKSTDYLNGENDADSGNFIQTTGRGNKIISSINAIHGIDFDDSEDLFIITLFGDPGKTATIRLDEDLTNTYCEVDGNTRYADKGTSITVTSSESANKGMSATVKLTMDKVTDFNGSADANTGITVTITNERTKSSLICVLNNALLSNGGNRVSTTIPTFSLENTVLDGDTYTVEVSGIGFVTYKKTGVTFDKAVEITNSDFIPGDVNADGLVDAEDKKAFLALDGEYLEAADFNRDGLVDNSDYEILKTLPGDEASAPAKMDVPTVTGGTKKVTVEWTKPNDDSITGYTIKYGTSKDKMSKTKEVNKGSTLTTDVTGLSAGTTYYVQIAAKNANGTGEYSDAASAKTDADSTQGGGGSGGGGSSSGGGSGSGGGGGISGGSGSGTTTPSVRTEETFTDLSNHAWAKDAIYRLKDKGIISGVSDTEFAPANKIKRGDFILILTRMLSVSDSFTANFADVPEGAYYYSAIGSAKAAGIAQGSGENFMPEDSITRQDLITLAYRAFLSKGYITETTDLTSLDAFGDKDSISDYAKTAMASMVKSGIIQGADGNVNPKGNATRAEVAVMCARLIELVK